MAPVGKVLVIAAMTVEMSGELIKEISLRREPAGQPGVLALVVFLVFIQEIARPPCAQAYVGQTQDEG
ncbi:hypothetical protein D3C73_1513410 [compost metagenome]